WAIARLCWEPFHSSACDRWHPAQVSLPAKVGSTGRVSRWGNQAGQFSGTVPKARPSRRITMPPPAAAVQVNHRGQRVARSLRPRELRIEGAAVVSRGARFDRLSGGGVDGSYGTRCLSTNVSLCLGTGDSAQASLPRYYPLGQLDCSDPCSTVPNR